MTKKRKIIFIILSIIFVLILVVGIKAYLFFNAKPNIKINYVAEWNKLSKPANYDPCQNAYFDYEKASAFVVMEPQKFSEPNWPDWPGDMNEVQLKILKDWLEDNKQAIEFFEQGTKKAYIWVEAPVNLPMWEVILPHLTTIRACANAICLRAKLNAYEKNAEKSFDGILTLYRAGVQQQKPSKTLIEQLVGNALFDLSVNTSLTILANENADANKIADFQKQFENISKNTKAVSLISEKYFFYDIFQRIFTDDGKGNGHLLPNEAYEMARLFQPIIHGVNPSGANSPSFLTSISQALQNIFSSIEPTRNKLPNFYWLALTGPDRKKHIEILEKICKYYEQIEKMEPWQIKDKNIDIQKDVEEMAKNYYFIESAAPVYNKIFQRQCRTKVQEYALITICSLIRFKFINSTYPETLDELVKAGFIKELPKDPYHNGTLIYKKTGDDFILYSYGPNFIDNGGKIEKDEYGRIDIWSDKGDAVFWPVEKNNK